MSVTSSSGSLPVSTPEVAGPLGTLALSQVEPHSSTASLRAVKWHKDLERLGLVLPFAVVHDFGMVLAAGREQIAITPRVDWTSNDARLGADCDRYRAVLAEAYESEAARRAPQLQMSDELIAVDDEGEQVPLKILSVAGDQVTVDFNHPLAGATLHFDILVKEVRAATEEELEHGHVHGPDGHHH